LGVEPVRALYEAVVVPIAKRRTKGAWYRDWRLVSLDGSTLDVADTAENEEGLGRPGASRGSSAFPKLRFVGLLENGTHVLWAAQMAPYATDEITLARQVVPALQKGMLCLADRFFPGYPLWQAATQTGADLLWRTRQNALVKQEFYGLLMAHFAIRGLMHEAALQADEDPDRLSFLHSVRVGPTAPAALRRYSPLGTEKPFMRPCSGRSSRSGSVPVATAATRAA
jgi:hypothetical protein